MPPMVYCVGLFRISPALPCSLCSKMKMTACDVPKGQPGNAELKLC